jgi:hypothetical protein
MAWSFTRPKRSNLQLASSEARICLTIRRKSPASEQSVWQHGILCGSRLQPRHKARGNGAALAAEVRQSELSRRLFSSDIKSQNKQGLRPLKRSSSPPSVIYEIARSLSYSHAQNLPAKGRAPPQRCEETFTKMEKALRNQPDSFNAPQLRHS